MEIFCNLLLTEKQIDRLRNGIGTATLHVIADDMLGTVARSLFERSEIVFGNPPSAWIGESSALRWVQLESVGFGEYLLLDWNSLGKRICVTNLSGFFRISVAESILAGVMALHRGIDRLVLLKEARSWEGGAIRTALRSLSCAEVVLFGQGSINIRVAELLQPFGCFVTFFRRGWSGAALNAALGQADLVVSAVPDLPETRDVFDRTRLARFKHGAIFANFGRGSVVDDDALADGLSSGSIGGAVIDVTRYEPLPADHRFWTLPNLILTQHSGGGTENEIERKIDWFLNNMTHYLLGDPLISAVDFARGY